MQVELKSNEVTLNGWKWSQKKKKVQSLSAVLIRSFSQTYNLRRKLTSTTTFSGISAWLPELYEKSKLTKAPSISRLVKTLAPGQTLARAPITLAGCKQNYIKLLIILKQKNQGLDIHPTAHQLASPATALTRIMLISKAHKHSDSSNLTAWDWYT